MNRPPGRAALREYQPFRNIFNLGFGLDNALASTSRTKLRIRLSITNLLNTDALYNFNSTFSGTHFVAPRAFQVQAGLTF